MMKLFAGHRRPFLALYECNTHGRDLSSGMYRCIYSTLGRVGRLPTASLHRQRNPVYVIDMEVNV